MNRKLTWAGLALTGVALTASPALAHTGIGATSSFMAGLSHPLGGLDHVLAMVAVGLWAALRGGKALWVWPSAFVGVMLLGGGLGMAGLQPPLVEPVILASVIVLGLLVAGAAKLPVGAGAAIIGVFALSHGLVHGAEMPLAGGALVYALGFAVATAALHGIGIAVAVASRAGGWRTAIRTAGALVAAIGAVIATGA